MFVVIKIYKEKLESEKLEELIRIVIGKVRREIGKIEMSMTE